MKAELRRTPISFCAQCSKDGGSHVLLYHSADAPTGDFLSKGSSLVVDGGGELNSECVLVSKKSGMRYKASKFDATAEKLAPFQANDVARFRRPEVAYFGLQIGRGFGKEHVLHIHRINSVYFLRAATKIAAKQAQDEEDVADAATTKWTAKELFDFDPTDPYADDQQAELGDDATPERFSGSEESDTESEKKEVAVGRKRVVREEASSDSADVAQAHAKKPRVEASGSQSMPPPPPVPVPDGVDTACENVLRKYAHQAVPADEALKEILRMLSDFKSFSCSSNVEEKRAWFRAARSAIVRQLRVKECKVTNAEVIFP